MAWQTGRIKIDLNGDGIREMLKSAEVQDMLDGSADRIADAANAKYNALTVGARKPGERADTTIRAERRSPAKTATRGRSRVVADHPAALAVEGKHRVLGSSTDAGRV